MSAADLQLLAQEKAFEPTQRFAELPADHVPHKDLGGEDVDDTDHWAGRGQEGIEVARAFFSNVLRPYAKNLDLRLLLAVHDHYRELEEYIATREFLREFEVPALSPPAAALGRILAQRIGQSSRNAALGEVFEDGAIDRLEAEYDRLGRDLRKTLTIVYIALAKAGPPFPERITKDHIRDTARGLYPAAA